MHILLLNLNIYYILLSLNFNSYTSYYIIQMLTGVIKNQNIDIDLIVLQTILHQGTNILAVLTVKMIVVQRKNIVEGVRLLVASQVFPTIHINTVQKVPKLLMIMRKKRVYNLLQCLLSKMISQKQHLKMLNQKLQM